MTTTTTSTPAGVVHLWGISPFGYKVMMAAAHKGVALEAKIAALPAMIEAKKRTGKRKTPFVVAGDRWLSDSTSICTWLEEFPGPSLFPHDARERAECALLEDWADEGLNRAAEPFIWAGGNRVPRLAKMCADEQTHLISKLAFIAMRGHMKRLWNARANAHGGIELTRELLCAQMDLVENRLAGRAWLFGESPTIADLSIAAMLANLVRFEISEDLDRRPALAAMVRRATSVLPWRQA